MTVRGSMNLNANPRFEQFDVSDDPAVTAVVHEAMAELWDRAKPIAVKRLKHSDATALLDAGQVTHQPVAWGPQLARWF